MISDTELPIEAENEQRPLRDRLAEALLDWRAGVGAAVVALVLVVTDLLISGVSRFWAENPMASQIIGGALLIYIALVLIELELQHKRERESERLRGAAYAALREALSDINKCLVELSAEAGTNPEAHWISGAGERLRWTEEGLEVVLTRWLRRSLRRRRRARMRPAWRSCDVMFATCGLDSPIRRLAPSLPCGRRPNLKTQVDPR